MGKVLLYNIRGKKSTDIKIICHSMNLSFESVNEDDYGLKLSSLLGLNTDSTRGEGELFGDEMLYLFNLSQYELNVFLSMLRRKKATVALKAMATETNLHYTSFELYKEISAEHKAMQSGESQHN